MELYQILSQRLKHAEFKFPEEKCLLHHIDIFGFELLWAQFLLDYCVNTPTILKKMSGNYEL